MAGGKTFALILFQDAARIEHDVLTIGMQVGIGAGRRTKGLQP